MKQLPFFTFLVVLLTSATATMGQISALPEPTQLVFIPKGGYKRTTRVLGFNRLPSALAAAPGLQNAFQGTRKVPVLLLNFYGTQGPYPPSAFQEMLFGQNVAGSAPKRTLTQYYKDMSNGRLTVLGDIYGWYSLPMDSSHYAGEQHGLAGPGMWELLDAAFRQAEANIDLRLYDNDGPDGIPNSGDDDGKVDLMFLIHSEAGAECWEGAPGIWSHEYSYSKWAGHPYVTKYVRMGKNGKPSTNPDGSTNYITIDDYAIQPSIGCPDSSGNSAMVRIGVFCHEFGHALFLPDLYDRTPNTGPDSRGLGTWCVMSYGSYGAQRASPETPVSFCAWAKKMLGWANVIKITQTGIYSLQPVEGGNTIYRIDVPGGNEKEYFLVEYKDPSWSDPLNQKINWDAQLPGPGLAIWHIDENVGGASDDWPFAPPDEGENDAPSIPHYNNNGVADGFETNHSLVSLIQQNKLLQLERNQGYADIAYLTRVGDTFGDDDTFRAGSRTYSGAQTGISISQIDLNNLTMFVQITPPVVASALNHQPGPNTLESVPVAAAPAQVTPRNDTGALQVLAHRVETSHVSDLSASDLTSLKGLRDSDIDAADITPAQRFLLKDTAGKLRTETLSERTKSTIRLITALQELKKENKTEAAPSLQYSPTFKEAAAVAGLSLPTGGKSKQSAAAFHLTNTLASFIGTGIILVPQTKNVDALHQAFQQVVKLDSKELPIWGASADAYYNTNGSLTSITSTAIPGDRLKIQDPTALDMMSTQQVTRAVGQLLGLTGPAASRIKGAEQCIFLDDSSSGKGIRAFKVSVSAGSDQEPIIVIFDPAASVIRKIQ